MKKKFEAPEERETSQTRERVQERDVESRNENNVPSTQSQNSVNKQNAIKSVPQKSTTRKGATSEERNRMNNNSKE